MDYLRFAWKKLKRAPLLWLIKDLVSWDSSQEAIPGYTIVIACMRNLGSLAAANVRLVSESKLDRTRELLLVFDCAEAEIPEIVVAQVREARKRIPIRMVGYSAKQVRISRMIDWGWVYCWLSWTIGISEAKTRHVILHDLDALALDLSLFETLYTRALNSEKPFSGIVRYEGSGVTASMNMSMTFQLTIDSQYVKRNFSPFDGYNRLAMIDGRLVDFDTFLWMQWCSEGMTHIQEIDESKIMHPTQMICNYVDFLNGRRIVGRVRHSLVLIPYLMYLGGDDSELALIGAQLRLGFGQPVTLCGKELPVDHLPREHWAWLEKQTRRVEQTLYNATRPEVEEFLQGIIARAGSMRTVGREDQTAGGVAEK